MKIAALRQWVLIFVATVVSVMPALAADLPLRDGPRPATTDGVPHVQIGAVPVPEISAALLRRAADIPGVEVRDTVISLPGAQGFWLTDDVALARPEAIVGGREFAHLHPDGSLHASLSPALAAAAVAAGWATPHPWADRRPGWEGFVLIYTPETAAEAEVVFDLVMGSYRYVTGKDGA